MIVLQKIRHRCFRALFLPGKFGFLILLTYLSHPITSRFNDISVDFLSLFSIAEKYRALRCDVIYI